MINNIWFKIIAGNINKIPEFYTIFARKMPDYIIRQRDRGQAEAKISRPRPKFWPQTSLELDTDMTSEVQFSITHKEIVGYHILIHYTATRPVNKRKQKCNHNKCRN